MVLFIQYYPLNRTYSLKEQRCFKLSMNREKGKWAFGFPLNCQNKTNSRTTPLNKGWVSFVLFKLFAPMLKICLEFLDNDMEKMFFHICNSWNTGARQSTRAKHQFPVRSLSASLQWHHLQQTPAKSHQCLKKKKKHYLLCHPEVPFMHWGNISPSQQSATWVHTFPAENRIAMFHFTSLQRKL